MDFYIKVENDFHLIFNLILLRCDEKREKENSTSKKQRYLMHVGLNIVVLSLSIV